MEERYEVFLVIDGLEPGEKVDYEGLLVAFVTLHAGRSRQRTGSWLLEKRFSVGGSEIAALMGWNPYNSFEQVVAAKAGVQKWDGGSVACWWGTMFESAIERFVEIDCGTRLAGTDISVPAPESSGLLGLHANSPDGYGVVSLFLNDEDEWQLLTTDAETRAAAEGRPQKRIIALLEFKCPYRRRPRGDVPKHYQPQIWSGLALSPIAHMGIFVDAVFRKCALWNLGPTAGYDRAYHLERTNPDWTTPIAWGLTGIYAPRLDAPRGGNDDSAAGDGGDLAAEDDDIAAFASEASTTTAAGMPVDAAYEAWLLHYKEFGIPFESAEEAARAGRPFRPDPVDFGECQKSTFETMMLHLDQGRFRAEHVGPCTADGRGAPLRTDREIGAAVDRLAANPPPHHFLLGVIPWKILEVDYVFQERRPGFLEEVGPLIRECLDMAARFREAVDPAREYYNYLADKRQAHIAAGGKPKNSGVSVTDVQDLFDDLAG